MASQDARLSKFQANFKQQQSEMTNKINTVLKAITNRISGALPRDMCLTRNHNSINSITFCPKQLNKPHDDESEEEEREERSNPENINTTLPSPPDPSISFIMENIRNLNSILESKYEDSHEEGPEDEANATIEGLEVGYFDTFPTRSKLAYHKLYLIRISLEVFRKFHWTILGGKFNQLSHVSSLLLSKPKE
ncbi:hypothetical protein Tco_0462929 [Tanacetum coccineum]